jgi:hypothetical protein
VVAVLTLEIALVKNYNYVGGVSEYVFIAIASSFIIGQNYVLQFVHHRPRETATKPISEVVMHRIVRILQYVLSIILIAIFLQMTVMASYYSIMLGAVTFTSYGLAIFTLGLLAQRFFSWFKSNGNGVVLLYGLASVALTINASLTLAFVSDAFFNMPATIRPNSIEFYFLAFRSLENFLSSAYIVSSIVSFILTWVATASLLRPYSIRLGRVKYWIVVSLPLVYFLSQFPSFSLNLFASLLNSDPVFYGVVLSVIFIVSQTAGGILFGVAFWTIARTIQQGSVVRHYLLIAAIGFVLLFVSNQAVVLFAAPYPPLGLASISFMGLASYLIFVGIYSSAVSVSHDSKLRESIRRIAANESRLLDSIGMAQMLTEIQKRVMRITKENQDRMNEETGIQSSLTEDDMKQYLEEVMEELKKHPMKDDHASS